MSRASDSWLESSSKGKLWKKSSAAAVSERAELDFDFDDVIDVDGQRLCIIDVGVKLLVNLDLGTYCCCR